MSVKENLYTCRKKNQKIFTITADVSNILRVINDNANTNINNNLKSWKNNTHQMVNINRGSSKKKQFNETHNSKIIKNITNKTNKTKTLTNKANLMTEADIDKLFNVQKPKKDIISQKKIKIETDCKLRTQNAVIERNKEFANQFIEKLKCQDQYIDDEDPMEQFLQRRLKVDFTQCVQFLKIEDSWDRLLGGLSKAERYKKMNTNSNQQLNQQGVNDLFKKHIATQPQEVQYKHNVNLTQQFKKNFLVGKIIGEGAYASVRIAIYKPYNAKIAIKIYQKNKIKEIQRKKSIRREIKILQLLNHPNIVKIYDVIETNNHLNIIMQYLEGISLNVYLKSQNGYQCSQKNCKKIIKPLIQGLRYLHQKNIAHRDIKLENIILDQHTLNPKLIDFGFSTCIQKSKKVKIFCGTPSYMAPQIIQKKQYRGQIADIWAVGVLFYVTLTGNFPFKGATDQELYKKINNADYVKSDIPSKEAYDLISKMLKIEPQQRITASQIMNHPWITNNQLIKTKKTKKVNQQLNSTNLKRGTLSSQKQKDEGLFNKTMGKKMIETCKQNLKVQLRMARRSPSNLNLNETMMKVNETRLNEEMGKMNQNEKKKNIKIEKNVICSGEKKQKNKEKINSKVLDLLRGQMKKRQEEKEKDISKGKLKRY